MKRKYFEKIEALNSPLQLKLDAVISQLAFNDDGLIPVITQDQSSHQILMFAWMNQQALLQTIETKQMTYWSRSRNRLWIKGETSGHIQVLKSMSIDCDGDVVLCKVEQTGCACHTGRKNCFYIDIDLENKTVNIPSI